VRKNMVESALRLLATEGVEGTSFSAVLAKSNAPRGSVYHHFPGGKSELLHAALDHISQSGLATMELARGEPVEVVVDRFLDLWKQLLDSSHNRAGCAVVAVTVAAGSNQLLEHAGEIFRAWTAQLTSLFVAGGMRRDAAKKLSLFVVAASEGAVLLARAEQNKAPFDTVAKMLREVASGWH
jgi:TetR/AcrR family transcriptional regulator, lmrAB and yxaGH operons repressor